MTIKVLLRRNVAKLGKIGDIVEVKPGYARNYLIPQRVGVIPTEANIKAIEAEKESYLKQLAVEQVELQAKADLVQGKEITISALCNEEGHLYGSIGPAQISAVLAEEGIFVEDKYIVLDEHIQQLDKYDVTISFNEEVSATIHVWVVPDREQQAEATEELAAEVAGTESVEPVTDENV